MCCENLTRLQAVIRARAALTLRRRRVAILPAEIGEPAWDMMLLLYCGDCKEPGVAELADLVGVSHSTATRWIRYLEQCGLAERGSAHCPDPAGLVKLTEDACAAMDRIFAAVR